jgi:ankyrin repeat protein
MNPHNVNADPKHCLGIKNAIPSFYIYKSCVVYHLRLLLILIVIIRSTGTVYSILQELLRVENVCIKDEDGMTLLHWAADRGFTEIANKIIEIGPSLIDSQVRVLKVPVPVL